MYSLLLASLHQGSCYFLKHYNQQATITTTRDDIPKYHDIIL
jgi:hypothetical protein